ncbi:MAG: 50S ribosomal protein L35 [Alphaproteobacteria bacterium]|nr:50S ribosomal protein L35 [Alphaproteobacteria bacterium]
MYKLKTKSSCKKRFKKTATGLFMRARACHKHNMRNRSMRSLRAGRRAVLVSPADAPALSKMMPY